MEEAYYPVVTAWSSRLSLSINEIRSSLEGIAQMVHC
jgi:hypothetical protein